MGESLADAQSSPEAKHIHGHLVKLVPEHASEHWGALKSDGGKVWA